MTEAGINASCALRSLAAVAQGAVLPFLDGFLGDNTNTVGLQAGAVVAMAGCLNSGLHKARYADDASEEHFFERNFNEFQVRDGWTRADEIYRALDLLNVGFLLIGTIALFNGYGLPDSGGEFHDGSSTFGNDISGILDNAIPARWYGAGAEEYGRQNIFQEARVTKMAEADHRIAGLLKKQAAGVEEAGEALAGILLAVAGVYSICMQLYLEWASCQLNGQFLVAEAIADIALKTAIMVIVHAVTVCMAWISRLTMSGIWHKSRIHGAIRDGYQWVIDDVHHKLPQGAVIVGAPAVVESVTALTFSAAGGSSDSPHGHIPIARPFGQSATVSTRLAPYLNVVNQAEGQAQQPTSRLQQRAAQAEKAPPPAPGKEGGALDGLPDDEPILAQRMGFN